MVVVMKTTTSLENERIRSVSKEGDVLCWMVVLVMAKNHPQKRAHTLVFEGGGWRWLPRHVRRERQKKNAGAPCARPCCRCHRRGGWWWHLQLQVLSSSPSSFVDACSYRWCRRRCPFAPAAAGVVAVVVRWHQRGGCGERGGESEVRIRNFNLHVTSSVT